MKHKELEWWEEGGSGKIGNKVYYSRKGKIFKRKAPRRHNIIPTPKQAVVRERFTAAHRFAQGVITDPILKALYQKKAKGKCTAYAKAVSAFLRDEL